LQETEPEVLKEVINETAGTQQKDTLETTGNQQRTLDPDSKNKLPNLGM